MTKSCVAVTVRIKPLDKNSSSCGLRAINEKTVSVPKNQQPRASENREFKVDSILEETASQEKCFEVTTAPVIDSLLDGYNGTVLAYGQTGAGKSHTMFGPDEGDYGNRGLCSRAISSVFRQVKQRGLTDRATISLSAIECYNENMFDMLIEPPGFGQQPQWNNVSKTNEEQHLSRRTKNTNVNHNAQGDGGGEGGGMMGSELWLHEDSDGATQVRNLSVVEANNEEDALTLLYKAASTRTLSSHAMNSRSSRAHFILTIYLTVKSVVSPKKKSEKADLLEDGSIEDSNEEEVQFNSVDTVSKLHLVDLAGSERAERTNSVGLVMREAGFINKSLSFLEQVVMALANGSKTRQHVPYRRSKLTHLLKDSLGGNCRTSLVSCVCIEKAQLDQTIQTLKFSERMRCVQNYAIINQIRRGIDKSNNFDSREVIKLRKQVLMLKEEIIMHDVVSGLSKYRESNLMVQGSGQKTPMSPLFTSHDVGGGLSRGEYEGLFGLPHDEMSQFKSAIGKWVLSDELSAEGKELDGLPLMPSWQLVETALRLLKDIAVETSKLKEVTSDGPQNTTSVLEKSVTSVTGCAWESDPAWPTMKKKPRPQSGPLISAHSPLPLMRASQSVGGSPMNSASAATTPRIERPLSNQRLYRNQSEFEVSPATPPAADMSVIDLSPHHGEPVLREGRDILETSCSQRKTNHNRTQLLSTVSPSSINDQKAMSRKVWESNQGKPLMESYRLICLREKEAKKKGKNCAAIVNTAKLEIDSLSAPTRRAPVPPVIEDQQHISSQSLAETTVPAAPSLSMGLPDAHSLSNNPPPTPSNTMSIVSNLTISPRASTPAEQASKVSPESRKPNINPLASLSISSRAATPLQQMSRPIDNTQQQLRQAKKQYRDAFSVLQQVKEDLEVIKKQKTSHEEVVHNEFELWWNSQNP